MDPGMEVDVVGMGVENEGDTKTSDYLEHTTLSIIASEKCNQYFGNNWILPDMVCAGHLLGGKDACQG